MKYTLLQSICNMFIFASNIIRSLYHLIEYSVKQYSDNRGSRVDFMTKFYRNCKQRNNFSLALFKLYLPKYLIEGNFFRYNSQK